MAHDNFKDLKRRKLNLRDVHIEDVLPEHFAASYPKFISLLERYYEWQNQYDTTELLNHLFSARDITETDITLLNFIEDELLLGGSYFEGSEDKRASAQFSSVLFRAKGSKYSIEWFFRSFFGIDPEVIYPKENVFLLADANKPESLKTKIGPFSLRYLTNDKLYQTFAILVRAGIPVNQWKNLFKLFVHPAGMYLGGEVLLEGEANLSLGTIQNDAEIDEHESPILTLTPTLQPVPEGVEVTYTVGAGTSTTPAQTYLYPGTYKWDLEHIDTVDSDFVVPPPHKIDYTSTTVPDQTPVTEGEFSTQYPNRRLILDTISPAINITDIVGFDIRGPGIFGGSEIVEAFVDEGRNIVTIKEELYLPATGGNQYTITGGWQDLEVTVRRELVPADNAAQGDFVYDLPSIRDGSNQITFTIANDFYLTAEGLENYNIRIYDWCNEPQRNTIFTNQYGIADVHYIVTTTNINEDSDGQTINIGGTNLPDGQIYYYLADETTNIGSSFTPDIATLTTHSNDWAAVQPNVFGFANRAPITVSGGNASFTVYPKKDYITEGAQTFRVFLTGPATYADYHNDSDNVELLAYLDINNTQRQGALITLNDTSVYPQYSTGDQTVTEGNDIVINVSVTNEHNPKGDYFYNQTTETLTTNGVLWEILDDLDGRITTLTGREPFSAASTNLTMSTTTADGYYRGPQTATVRVTNHDVPAQTSTGTITMNDAAVSNPVISGPTSITEGQAGGSWSFTYKNAVPGTNYYWWVDGLADADFTSTPPRSGSRSTLTVDSLANSITAGGDTMIMTSTMDLAAFLDALTENTESFTIKVSDSNTDAANEIASFAVDITDVVPEYTVSSNTPVTEGNDIVLSLAVVNPVGEDVNVTVADDGTGRYTAGAYTFTSPNYNDITIPTSINAGLDNQQIIQVDVTGASSGQTDTTNVTLNDLLPTYTLTVRNTSDASITTLVEGGTIRLDLGVTDTVGEDVDWSVSPADARLGATSGTFSSPGYVDIDITTSAPTTFEDNVDLTFTVTGQSSGVQATDTLQLQDGPADITYTIDAPASNVTEGNAWSFTVNATLINTGTYEDFDWNITGDTRVNASDTILAADFVTGGGSVTVNRTSTSDPVYQGPTTITVDGTGATYSNTASDTFSLVDEAGSLNSVTGLDSLSDGGSGPNYSFAIAPNFFFSSSISGSPYEASVGFSLLSNGDMSVLGSSINPSLAADNWVTAADHAAGFGDDYQVQVISYSSDPSGFGSGTVSNSPFLSGSGSSSNNQGGGTSWDNGTGDWFRLNSTFTMAMFVSASASTFIEEVRYVDIEIKEFDGSNYGTGTTVLQKRVVLEVQAGGGNP